ncbi:hypothetical protein SmJEL517_g02607 [Synchytrium microbalum]|uniref:Uncharacterized protein n=1 Tax=Synchytrium microbalum TaxID=1806994 RepID=A0A507C5F7_9FUNG|nr:uncharacterized protein SmJEL517_g02607 [Synchytrium microbalum]TPX34912.1 hypothetical protein SmJEL517_g02607 [Synchytrium microbalum]
MGNLDPDRPRKLAPAFHHPHPNVPSLTIPVNTTTMNGHLIDQSAYSNSPETAVASTPDPLLPHSSYLETPIKSRQSWRASSSNTKKWTSRLVGTVKPGDEYDPVSIFTRELLEDVLYAFFLYRSTVLLDTPPLQPKTIARYLLIFIPMWYNYSLCVLDVDVLLPQDSLLATVWRLVRIFATFGAAWCGPSVFNSVEPTATAFICMACGLRVGVTAIYFVVAMGNNYSALSHEGASALLIRAAFLLPSTLLYIAGCFTLRELLWGLGILVELVLWALLGLVDYRLGSPLAHFEWQRARDRLARMSLLLPCICILDLIEVRLGVVNGVGQTKLNVSNLCYAVTGVVIIYGLFVMTRKQSALSAPGLTPAWASHKYASLFHHVSIFLHCITHAAMVMATGLQTNMLQTLYSSSLGYSFAPIVPPGAPTLAVSSSLTRRLLTRAIISTGGTSTTAPLVVRSLLTSTLITDTWQQEGVFAIGLALAMMFSTIAQWYDSTKGWKSLGRVDQTRLIVRLCFALVLAGPAVLSFSVSQTLIASSVIMGIAIFFEETLYLLTK